MRVLLILQGHQKWTLAKVDKPPIIIIIINRNLLFYTAQFEWLLFALRKFYIFIFFFAKLKCMGVLQKNLCTCHGSWFIILGLHGDKTWFWGLPWLNVPITTILVDLTWHTLTFGMKLGVSLELQLIYFESGVAFYLYLPWENVFP